MITGTGELARLIWRRDRVRLVAWVVATALLPTTLVSATASAYPTEAIRAGFAATAAANPAELALRGPVFDAGVGGLVAWTVVSSEVLLSGLVAGLFVVRHTRAEESDGRRELLASGVVGRAAPLAAALGVVLAANVLIVVLVTGGLAAQGLPVTGALALGAVLGAGGAVFAGMGAVAAQLATTPGAARGLAVGALGVALLLAAAGDLTRQPLWWALSPLGWARHVQAFAGERWGLLVPSLVVAAVAIAAAHALLARRDVGGGILAPRRGPVSAPAGLRGPLGLAWRCRRGALVGVAVGYAVLGALLGAVLPSLAAQLDGTGLTTGPDPGRAFLVSVLYVLAQLGTAFALSTTLRLRADESSGLADPVLVAPVGRLRWAGAQIVVAVAGTASALAALGLGAGLAAGAVLGDLAGRTADLLGTTLAFLPAALVLVGIAVVVLGWAPRPSVALAWTALAAVVVLDLLGEFRLVPASVLGLSPFVATLKSLDTGGTAGMLIALTALAVALAGLGLLGLRRRDLG